MFRLLWLPRLSDVLHVEIGTRIMVLRYTWGLFRSIHLLPLRPRYDTYDEIMEVLPKLPRPALITFARRAAGQPIEGSMAAASWRQSTPSSTTSEVNARHVGIIRQWDCFRNMTYPSRFVLLWSPVGRFGVRFILTSRGR